MKKSDKSPIDEKLDKPARSVRIWNQINPDLYPHAYVSKSEYGRGWVCPFVEGVQATDDEMVVKIIDIYNTTGRIVVDAISAGNFKRTPNGQIVCVDIGVALEMELEEEKGFLGRTRTRKKSIVSANFWKIAKPERYRDYYERYIDVYPNTIQTLRALLFMKEYRPDIVNAGFLETDSNNELRTQLSSAYYNAAQHTVALTALERIVPVNFSQMRKSCIKQLENYIASRGIINFQSRFEPSLMTKIFRNGELTAQKVEYVQQLIWTLKTTNTIEAIQRLIQRSQTNINLTYSRFSSGMAVCLAKCAQILQLEPLTEVEKFRIRR